MVGDVDLLVRAFQRLVVVLLELQELGISLFLLLLFGVREELFGLLFQGVELICAKEPKD